MDEIVQRVDWSLTVSIIAIATAVSINAYHYSRESKYLKRKYMDKGYWKGYRQAEKDCKVLQDIKDNQSKKK